MKGILADNNVEGHLTFLLHHLTGERWRELWSALELALVTFADLGLSPSAADAVLWRACQEKQVILLTANRNEEGPDSLEATIRAHNTPQSLPIFTIATAQQILRSPEYAERVAVRLLEHLYDIENLRGAGRMYLP
jgi:hypothetical protein